MVIYATVRSLLPCITIGGLPHCSIRSFSTGEAHKVDPGRQMVEIMELDYVDDIVSSALLSFFLLIVAHDFTFLHQTGW